MINVTSWSKSTFIKDDDTKRKMGFSTLLKYDKFYPPFFPPHPTKKKRFQSSEAQLTSILNSQ